MSDVDGAGDDRASSRIREESWRARGGRQVTVRAVRPADREGLRTFVDGLSRESRYYRFLTGGRVADEVIRGFVAHHPQRDVAVVVTVRGEDGAESIVANAEYVVNTENVAELAVVVADDWQGQGLGRRLIQRLQQIARASQLQGMRGDVLSENRRMLAIMRDCGFAARRNPDDSFLHEVSLSLVDARVSAPRPQREHRLPRDWFAGN
ncbi:GNAT family N-acetyltransferase [Cupriavidus pauculus]|uniref:GNAT family N-acetyltransferase n=1 Tax=Cupriavidus pauculus TaxID=82633 RepID=A0A2N5CBW1_9BURK|nr:GNAT family N-acetyltransferase [Cupriavidus pauculus]PLP99695.1 GNAT family N-acetyltransferase [Cupriavidus pauculus]